MSNVEGNARGQHSGCASAGAVAGLAREVEGLRMAMESVAPLPEQVQRLRDEVAPLPEQVTKLARVVKTLADHANPEQETRTAPLSWLDLADDDDVDGVGYAQEVLTELSTWLVRVFLRYPDGAAALPECWWWHPDVVEELLCLMRTWLAAYADKDGTVARAADWHDRYRPGVVKRIKASTANCSLENHQLGGVRYQPGPEVPSGQALAEIAAWWGAERTVTAPQPDADVIEQARAAEAARRRAGGGRQ